MKNLFQNLLKYLKPYKKESILAPAFKLVEALLDLIVPLVVSDIIKVGIKNGDKNYIILRFIFLIVLALVGLGFSITAQYFSAKASVGFATGLRADLFSHIQKFSYEKLDQIGTETLITRMTADVQQIQNGVNMVLRLLLRSPFIVFGALIMAFTINRKAALIFAVSIPVLTAVIFLIMAITIPLYRKVQSRLDGVLLSTRENLTGVRVIRAFCREDAAVEEFEGKNIALTKLNLFVGRIAALMNPATYVLINIATCVLFLVAGKEVYAGSMEQGDLVALYNYMAQMIVELVKLASLIITINKALACGDRVSDVLMVGPGMAYPGEEEAETADAKRKKEEKTETRDAERKKEENSENGDAESKKEDNSENGNAESRKEDTTDVVETSDDTILEFDRVCFTYEGAKEETLTNISFSVKKGQTVGIIGGTGSGKTTLVNLIPRFYDATSGTVKIRGRNVKDYGKGQLISGIGVVPQKAVLFAGSIRDNLKWGNENATEEELTSALEISQSAEIVEKKEGKLDALVEQGGKNFSGGQKQRLTIARALVKNPEILILDDSSSALDYATDYKLRKALHTLREDMTVFIVSQRTASIREADLILVLEDGDLAGMGSHEELLENCEIYREIHQSQLSGENEGVTA